MRCAETNEISTNGSSYRRFPPTTDCRSTVRIFTGKIRDAAYILTLRNRFRFQVNVNIDESKLAHVLNDNISRHYQHCQAAPRHQDMTPRGITYPLRNTAPPETLSTFLLGVIDKLRQGHFGFRPSGYSITMRSIRLLRHLIVRKIPSFFSFWVCCRFEIIFLIACGFAFFRKQKVYRLCKPKMKS